jgi:lauroyl/myristoyl acyltransferase
MEINMKIKNQLRKLRYYVEYLLTSFLFRIFKNVKIQTASNICGFISRYLTKWICKINGRHNIALKNLDICFPNKTPLQKEQILNKFYEVMGRFIGEYITQNQMDGKWLEENVEVINPEIFEKYSKEGFFGISAHFGNWEIMHRYFSSQKNPMTVVYKQQKNHLTDKILSDKRLTKQIPKGGNSMKQIITLIKQKRVIGILIDQVDVGADRFPFFGKGAKTGVGIQRLSLKYNFNMICAKINRKIEDPNKFTLTFYPPLEIEKTGNDDEDIKRLTQKTLGTLEEWIKESPEQWFLIYDRWI